MIGMYPRKHKIQNTGQNSYDVRSEGDPRVHLYDRNVLSEKQQIKPEESNQRVDPFFYVENVMMEDGDDIASPRVKLEPSLEKICTLMEDRCLMFNTKSKRCIWKYIYFHIYIKQHF